METLYLHVDVTNEAAIRLYTKAGYKVVEPSPTYIAFTRALNLHDGARNGRNHYLLYKDLKTPTILTYDEEFDVSMDYEKKKNQIGFEMPT